MKALVLAFAVLGCAADAPEPRAPGDREQVTDADRAVALARQAAATQGYEVAQYDLADVALDSDTWRVFFDHKPPGFPGGHFAAYVARDGGAVQLVPGK
jgi:hypothetical protein